uniref:Coiled-coil domain-containing protein 93 n=1 Tax=Rhodnius prolixus TaxID=13249 RepID=T1HMH9_RHOPR
MLLDAGYFRAKIKGLSEFDKVVGGMTWCIDICRMDLDVDLLFQENSTIGQKIALTEKIVAVLPKMNCPLMIEPHQIQGLDFVHIHPVIEWLVKKSIENREEHGDYLLRYAVHQFSKEYCFPHEKPNENFILRALPNISAVQNKYRPQRKFRRIEVEPKDTFSRVQSTLFEYGHDPTQECDSQLHQNLPLTNIFENSFRRYTNSKKANFIFILKLCKSEIAVKFFAFWYKTLQLLFQLNISIFKLKKLEKQLITIQLGEKIEIRRLKEKEGVLLKTKEIVELKLKESREQLIELKAKTNFRKTNELNLSDKEKSKVKQLEIRLLINNSLIEQENQFKEHCKLEKARLQALIKEIGENKKDDLEAEDALKALNEQVSEARINLAKVSRAETVLYRLIDEVPTRAELAQYQRRFLELYNQVSAKHRETKQFYTLYNTLNDQHQYLSKELSLLNSIYDGYNSSLKSINAKDEFICQLENIIDGIKHNKLKVEQRRNEERDLKEKLKGQLSSLIDQQRQYASLLKQFTDECQLNQNLLAQVKNATV